MICLLDESFLKAAEAVVAPSGHLVVDVRDADQQDIADAPRFELGQRRNTILRSK